MKLLGSLCRFSYPIHTKFVATPRDRFFNNTHRFFSAFSEDSQLNEFMEFMDNLKNFEKSGVPKDAGTDSDDGFDLGRMKRLMELLGHPQSKFKAIHIAGTKGKGSTAAYLSSILRAEGYSVGSYTSPHIRSIRERITLGTSGESVSAQALNNHFQRIKAVLQKAVELENKHLSHFEVFTAMAFSFFAQEDVDIAIIEAGLGGARDATNIISNSELSASIITSIGEEHMAALGGSLESIAMAKSGIIKYGRPLVLGGPFLPHIERILRDKASSMSSPIVLASDPGNKSVRKGFSYVSGQPYQSCDIVLAIDKEIPVFIELLDLKLRMLGSHQLQNAATATCAALCLQNQGWRISGKSIRAGLESASLLGRSQFLTPTEAEELGLPGATIILDGAHTKDSARALADTVNTTFPTARVILVVAMANDKDHLGFASELLSVKGLEAVFLTEVSIAGDKTRTTSVSVLKDSWIRASREKGIHILDRRVAEHESVKNLSQNPGGESERRAIIFSEGDIMASIRAGNQILSVGSGDRSGIIIVTGSLHSVSAVLGSLQESS